MKKYFIAILLSLGLGYLGGYFLPTSVTGPVEQMVGGVRTTADHFVTGLFAGRNDEFAVDESGNVTLNNLTVNGTCTGDGCGGSAYTTVTASDTPTSINTTLSTASSTGGSGVLFNSGTYSLSTASDTLRLQSNTNLLGEGDGTLFNVSVPYTSHPIGAAGINASSTYNSTIQNIRMDGSAQTTTPLSSDRLIGIGRSHNIKINNVTLQNANQFALFIEDQPITGSLSNGSSTDISLQNSYLSCTGGQDCIGGGPHVSNGNAEVSDVNVIGNFIRQTVNQGGTINVDFDANCLNMVRVLRLNVAENNCFGDIVFGNEQTPHQFSKITGNIVNVPNGTTTVAGEIAIQQNGSSASATRTPTNLLVASNVLQAGQIIAVGHSSSRIENLLIFGNSLRTATSTAQTQGTTQNGIDVSQSTYNSIFGNDLKALTGAAGVTGIKLSNASNTTVAFNNIRDFPIGIDLGSGTGNKSIFNNIYGATTDITGGSNIIGMNDSGQVYIGTSTASNKLEIVNSGTNGLRVWNSNGTSVNTGAGVQLQNLVTPTAAGHRLAFILMGATAQSSAGISALADESWTIGSAQGSTLIFQTTANGTATRVERLRVTSSGLVGIGTTSPISTLTVMGTSTLPTTSVFTVASSSGASLFNVLANGNVGVGTSSPAGKFSVSGTCTNFGTNGVCTDYAEIYPSSEEVEMGEILSIDGSDVDSLVKRSNGEDDGRMIGIVSTNPAIVIEGSSVDFMNGVDYKHNPRRPAIALAGRVPVKVIGDVKAGDFVTSSGVPGKGMKATRSGEVVGQAIQDSENGTVLVFVKPGYQAIDTEPTASSSLSYLPLFGLLGLLPLFRRKQ